MKAKELVTAYYSAFNRRDAEALLSILHEGVIHDINQGKRELGKSAFRDFLGVMDAHYQETVVDLVVMVSDDGKRASAEFRIEGTYKKSVPGLPAAKQQKYDLPVGAFFEIRDNKISRVTNYYNMNDWIAQVSK